MEMSYQSPVGNRRKGNEPAAFQNLSVVERPSASPFSSPLKLSGVLEGVLVLALNMLIPSPDSHSSPLEPQINVFC